MKKATKEIKFIEKILDSAFETVIKKMESYGRHELTVPKISKKVINAEFKILKKEYIKALILSQKLAKKAFQKNRFNKSRLAYLNPIMDKYKKQIINVYPPAASAWVLDGIILESQRAGLKKLAGLNGDEGYMNDVLNSAASLNLGAENPWLIKADRYEDHLGVKDNLCSAYHPGLRHAFALNEFAKLYPNKKVSVVVHSESSGSVVDSIAIESAIAYVEKTKKDGGQRRILAVDGTWAGNYGPSKEGTGFGVDAQTVKRAGKTLWVDRCLPPPTKNNRTEFLKIISEKIKNNQAAGLYLEPDIIGDLGMIIADPETLNEAKKLFQKENLPIILDCVQQLGRTGSYWGENVDNVFSDYPLLILTTAKSSSNGQPFGFTIIPKIIAESANPVSQISTNQMNGPLLRALVVAQIFQNKKFQNWLKEKQETIEKIAKEHGFENGDDGFRGKYLNRGIFVGDNEKVKLLQVALLIEDGVLVGALPQSLRYQPMLLELSETNELIAKVIFRRVKKVTNGEISKIVLSAYERMKNLSSGLARK